MTDPLFDRDWSLLTIARDDSIVQVTLNRPAARNALNGVLMAELTEVARLLHRRTDVWAVILAGAETYFSAGADLGGVGDRAARPSVMESRESVMAGPDMCAAWEEIEAVTIVAIEGFCIGGACALAVACDFRIMANDAYVRLPEVPLGINMSWRSVPRIVSLVGPARAKRFVMFGQAADAQTCLDWGMADEIAPKGQALTVAKAWAQKVVALPPLPVRMTKEQINRISGANHLATSSMDRDQYLLTARTKDFREGVSAFFEKRPGAFNGD